MTYCDCTKGGRDKGHVGDYAPDECSACERRGVHVCCSDHVRWDGSHDGWAHCRECCLQCSPIPWP